MARKFLYVVAALVVLVLCALLAYRIWAVDLLRIALTPSVPFTAPPPLKPDAYAAGDMWWQRTAMRKEGASAGNAAIFFVPPTSFVDRSAWNARLDDDATNALTVKQQAISVRVFHGASGPLAALWVPKYRQATMGAFLTDKPERLQAFDVAYQDVRAAFLAFLAANPEGPIILAGQGQGSFHLLRLWRELVKGQPLAQRIAVVYAPGWPVERSQDLGDLGLRPCVNRDDIHCLMSWHSYADPRDRALEYRSWRLNRQVVTGRKGSPAVDAAHFGTVCTNPVKADILFSPETNADALVVGADLEPLGKELANQRIPTRCTADGALDIGPPPKDFPGQILPGNDYQVYDYALLWGNIENDVTRRLESFNSRKPDGNEPPDQPVKIKSAKRP